MASLQRQFALATFFILTLHVSHVMPRKLQHSSVSVSVSVSDRHEQWMTEHGRVYTNAAEKESRLRIFKANVEYIESVNADGAKGYKLVVNKFADQTIEEFKAAYNGYKRMGLEVGTSMAFRYENVTSVPTSVDWREKGAVTPVKTQGECGSCWAFAAVAGMEGITKLSTGTLISLSEQELIDCDINGENEGCNGGEMEKAYEFIKQNKGLTSESNYPYQGPNGTCDANKEASRVANITGYETVPANSEKALLNAVANQPVAVSVDAGWYDFVFYSSGVFTGQCGSDDLNHGVAAVGYGVGSDGVKYWLVKNSWGPDWGEDGYIRIERDVDAKEGRCGIAAQACYPVVN